MTMAQAARKESDDKAGLVLPDLLALCREALGAADRLKEEARAGVAALVMRGAKVDAAALEREALILQAGFGEYLAQMSGGIAVSQVEILRMQDMGLGERSLQAFATRAVTGLGQSGNTNAVRMRLAELILEGDFGDTGLGDE